MSEGKLHSLILACDYRVDDVARIWELFERQRSGLAAIGVHHVVGYLSLWDPGRILVTMGIRHPRSVRDVLRSPAIFELFDTSGSTTFRRYSVARWSRRSNSTTTAPAIPSRA